MKVFYINLKKRKDRKDHMEEMLSNLNLDYHRFEAIRPSIGEIKFGKYKKFYEKSCPRFKDFVNTEVSHGRAIGVFGCYISHYMIHTSQVGIEEPYIILEDDADAIPASWWLSIDRLFIFKLIFINALNMYYYILDPQLL